MWYQAYTQPKPKVFILEMHDFNSLKLTNQVCLSHTGYMHDSYTSKNCQPESSTCMMYDIMSVSDVSGTESGMVQTCYIVLAVLDLSEKLR